MHDGLKSGLLTHRRDELRLASLRLFNARRLGPDNRQVRRSIHQVDPWWWRCFSRYS